MRRRRTAIDAIRAGAAEAGRLALEARIGPEGEVIGTQISRGSGSDELDRAAEATFARVARLTPAMNRHQRVPVTIGVELAVER